MWNGKVHAKNIEEKRLQKRCWQMETIFRRKSPAHGKIMLVKIANMGQYLTWCSIKMLNRGKGRNLEAFRISGFRGSE
jgi:hypothetical protein